MKELSDVTSQKQSEVPRSMRELEEADREQKKAEETAKVNVFATVLEFLNQRWQNDAVMSYVISALSAYDVTPTLHGWQNCNYGVEPTIDDACLHSLVRKLDFIWKSSCIINQTYFIGYVKLTLASPKVEQ